MSMTVTADASSGAFGNGISLRVEVLTNAAVVQNGASGEAHTLSAAIAKAITTTVVGSRVYGAALNNNTSFTVNASTTAIDNIADATNGIRYGTCKQKTDTVTTGSETIGYSTTRTDGGIAVYEVVPVSGQTLVEDGSAPVVKTVTSSSIATSAGFTPPQGSTLVALVSAKSSGVTVSDSRGLTWTKQIALGGTDGPGGGSDGTASVWTARVPDAASGDPYIAATGTITSAVTSLALPVLHNVAVGDELIVEFSMSSGTSSSVSDSQGNTYTFDQTVSSSQNNYNYTCKVTHALTAGTDTITPVKSGTSGTCNLIVVGIPNATASPIEGSSISQVSSGTSTAPSVTSGTLSQASEILIAFQTSPISGKTPVWSAPFDTGVMINVAASGGSIIASLAWVRTNATTPVTAAATITSALWEMMLTAVKVTPTGGIGSVAMHKMSLAASGGEKESGTGSVHMHKMAPAVTAATTSKVTATGSVKMHKMGTSSAGKETEAGTGSVSMHKMGMSDAGTEKFTATGSVSMHKMGLGASGKEIEAATGSVKMHKMGLSSSGKETEAGTGSVARHKMTIHGFNASPVSGSGSVARHKMATASSGNGAAFGLYNSAASGTDTVTVTAANSGSGSGNNAFDVIQIPTGGSVTYDASNAWVGKFGYKIVTGSPVTNGILEWTTAIGTAVPKLWFSFGIKLPSLPASGTLMIAAARNGATTHASMGITSAGKVVIRDAASATQATGTTTIPTGQYVRIEGYFVGDASVGQGQVKVFSTSPLGTTPDETITTAATINTTGTVNRFDVGNQSSIATFTMYVANVAIGTKGYIGPPPVGSVNRHKMGISASGTQTGPTWVNNFSGLTNGTTLTTGNTGGVSGYPFDVISIPASGTLAADNTHLGLDAMALKVATAGTAGTPAAEWTTSIGAARTKLYFRVDCLKTASASPTWRPIVFRTTGGTHVFSILISGNAVSGSYASGFTGLTAFTTATANGSYFRVEGWFDSAAGTAHMELYAAQKDAYPVEQHDYSGLTFGATAQRVDVGNGNSAASDGPFWLDYVAVSPDASISPPSVKMHKMGLSSSGKETEAGTGSVARHKMGMAATGHVAYGSVKMHKMGLSSSGKETEAGSGSVKMHKMGLSSSGIEKESGTGSVRMHKMGVAGAGSQAQTGIGVAHMHKMGLSSSGKETEAGSGSVRMHKMGMTDVGVETFFGTGNVSMHKMGLAGTAELKVVFHGTVAVRMRKMHVLGQNPPIEHGSLFVFTAV